MASCRRIPGQPGPRTTVVLPAGAGIASRLSALVNETLASVESFASGAEQADDITILAFHVEQEPVQLQQLDIVIEPDFKEIERVVQENSQQYTDADRTFSYSSYFKKPKCRVDYNNCVGIIESENIIDNLLSK